MEQPGIASGTVSSIRGRSRSPSPILGPRQTEVDMSGGHFNKISFVGAEVASPTFI